MGAYKNAGFLFIYVGFYYTTTTNLSLWRPTYCEGFLWEISSRPNVSFHVASQGSVTHLEKCTTRPILHTRAQTSMTGYCHCDWQSWESLPFVSRPILLPWTPGHRWLWCQKVFQLHHLGTQDFISWEAVQIQAPLLHLHFVNSDSSSFALDHWSELDWATEVNGIGTSV